MAKSQYHILYIRHKRAKEISDAFKANQDEWVETLSMHADLKVMSDPFDMDRICLQRQPDFIVYESPLQFAEPLEISNPLAHPHIPRLGFMMQDPQNPARVRFLRTIEQLNIRWIFSHMTDAALHQSPELKIRTYSVPHLFDPHIFREYDMVKDIPVSIFGGFIIPDIYAWRAQTGSQIHEHFPTLIYTHPGYYKPTPRHKFAVTGEAYARLLNRSYFSLADTTRFDYLVRKHLEIPASGSVLVAPDSPALKPYGFRDMENCILGSGNDLFKKIALVADNPELYENIRRAGYNLVHSRYTKKSWRGIFDFFECLKTLEADETIVQKTIFGGFEKVSQVHPPQAVINEVYPDNEIAHMSNTWLEGLFKTGDLSLSKEKMTEKANLFAYMSEYWIAIGIGALLSGELAYAQECFLKPQTTRLKNTGFDDYDPEEIAWLSLTASLTGQRELLDLVSLHAPFMAHLSLRRMQWLAQVLAGKTDASKPSDKVLNRQIEDHLSIHFTGQSSLSQWCGLIERILKANGQDCELLKRPLEVSPVG